MIDRLSYVEADGTDPYANLALEAYLLDTVEEGQCILYLWRNARTVVIGRNQNAADECDISALEEDGGHLARRLSGGGAVYHDLGNLNFTFLVRTPDYSLEAQNAVVLGAVRACGVHALRTGRNDLTTPDGRKFSGHAYYHTRDASYHHGTLMVDVDTAPLQRYLRVSPLKLASKGVRSVRSRVVNLAELAPGLTVETLKAALADQFGVVFGAPVETLTRDALDEVRLEQLRARFSSPVWILRDSRPLDASCTRRFDWGTVRLDLSTRAGHVADVMLWSDGLEADAIEAAPRALAGCPVEPAALVRRLVETGASEDMARDLAGVIMDIATDD